MLWNKAGIQIENIPFRGGAPALTALLSNEVQLSAGAPPKGMLDSGQIRIVGYANPKRFSLVPDVPAVGEAVPGFKGAASWFAISGPAGMPADVVARLNREIDEILKEPAVMGGPPEVLRKMVEDAFEGYKEAASVTGTKPE